MSIITIGKTKRQGLGPPPDWLQCPWNGKTIENTFVPFKTPLGSKYDKDVKQEYRFTVDMLIDSQKTDKKKLGVLVDLTNTTRYYDSSDVVKLGCNYFKIQCTGNKNPTVDQTNAFIQLCARFKDKKPQEMIAVHCTHGFHRTGFLIIAYLVEKKQKSVDEAVKLFAQARPPGIYKQFYLHELFRRYGDVNKTPLAAIRPEWCNETEEVVDVDENLIEADGSNRNDQRKRSGFNGSQPFYIDVNSIDFLRKKPYKCSWEDGTRWRTANDKAAPVMAELPEIKLFGKWSTEEIQVSDISLTNYIAVKEDFAKYLPHSSSRYQVKRFRKAQCPIVERIVNSLMMHGRNNGKKLMAVRIIKHAFEIIHLLTGENPLQVCVTAIINSGPREDSTRIGSAGTMGRQAVDVSPLRRVNQAIWLLCTGAREASFRNIKSIAECLADELINAAKGSSNSHAIKKKDELERVAKSNR